LQIVRFNRVEEKQKQNKLASFSGCDFNYIFTDEFNIIIVLCDD